MKRRSSPISSRISGGRPRPVLRAEGKDRQDADAEIAGGAHRAAQRLDAAAMAFAARQAARRRPAPVAIHDDGDVPRHGELADPHSSQRLGLRHLRQPHTVRISFSFAASILSISAIVSSVSLLHLLGRPLAVVLADLVVLLQLLEHIEAVAPHMPHRDPGGFGIFVRDLHQVLAALLVELGNAQPQHLPFGRRREAEIGGR